MPDLPQRYRRWLLTAVAALLSVGVAVTVTHDDGPTPRTTVTVVLGGPQPGKQTVTAPAAAVAQAQASELGDHQHLRGETPDGVPRAQLEAAQEQQDRLAATDQLPIVTPDAAPSQRGCVTRLVRNYSSRRGVRPRLLVAHYTVSRNRPGWDDVNAIVGLFDRASFAASSTYVIDAEGNCAYIVRESDKPWTQAAANPVSISIEFVAMGDEGALSPAALAKGGRVFADAAKRWEIPLQAGAVNGCTVARPGIVDHGMLGACGGGHHDISPFKLEPLLAAAKDAAGPQATARDRRACRRVNRWRNAGKRGGQPAAAALARRKRLHSRSLACETTGPVRR